MNHDAICDLIKTKPLSELTGEEMRSARDLAYSILRADYYRDVRGVAEDVKSSLDSGDITNWESLREYLHETVDGMQRVIYTREAQEAVILSDNGEHMIEEYGTDGVIKDGSVDWSLLAYHAVHEDVMEHLIADGIDEDYWDDLEEDTTEETESE